MLRVYTFVLLTLLFLSGCARPGFAPMERLYYNYEQEGAGKTLIVFLRGVGGSYEDFARRGLVDAIFARELPFGVVVPDAHFGYYRDRTLIRRLHDDVLEPARQAGYTDIWLVGVSMGGLGSMLYLREHPDEIQGVVLLSPFLGLRELVAEISGSDGLAAWRPGEYDADADWQRMLWDWIRTDVATGKVGPVFAGCGRDDRYRYGTDLLAICLPAANSVIVDGDHNYTTFLALWAYFLDRKFYSLP